jgi:hypothetical protein
MANRLQNLYDGVTMRVSPLVETTFDHLEWWLENRRLRREWQRRRALAQGSHSLRVRTAERESNSFQSLVETGSGGESS